MYSFDPQGQFTLNRVAYDAVNGLGAIGFNANVNYMGLTVVMTCREFLQLTPASPLDNDFLEKWIEDGKPIGAPFLWVQAEENMQDFRVFGHEGRHRVKAIQRLYGPNAKIAVIITFRHGVRARHLSATNLRDLRLLLRPERGGVGVSGARFEPHVHFNGHWIKI